jgi:hypothetical protein
VASVRLRLVIGCLFCGVSVMTRTLQKWTGRYVDIMRLGILDSVRGTRVLAAQACRFDSFFWRNPMSSTIDTPRSASPDVGVDLRRVCRRRLQGGEAMATGHASVHRLGPRRWKMAIWRRISRPRIYPGRCTTSNAGCSTGHPLDPMPPRRRRGILIDGRPTSMTMR